MAPRVQATCPCCGAFIEQGAALEWNADFRVLTGHGFGTTLGPVSGRIFDELWCARGRGPIAARELADRVYANDPDGGPLWAVKSMPVLMRALRRRLVPFGITIEATTRGRGAAYYLRAQGWPR